ncbi:MAG: hypothetical protein ABWY49_12265 [Rhizobium sp.]
MTSPAKTRSRSIAGIDPRMGVVVNDNTPPAYPGHELSDLDGVPRQPAAEAVAHYARLAQIPSFPMHPDEFVVPTKATPAIDVPERTRAKRPMGRPGATLAGVGSLLFHAIVLAALIIVIVPTPDPDTAMEEAGDTLSVVMLGDSDADQLASGEKSEQPPKPDEVVAEAIQPDVIQPDRSEATEAAPVQATPSETPPADAAQPIQPSEPLPEPVQPDQVQPTQTVTQVSPETLVSPEPEVLAAQAPAEPGEPAVVQPMATEVQPEESKPAEATPSEAVSTATEPETIQPTETAEAAPPPPEVVTPIEKPKPPVKPVQKPKDVVKKSPPKATKVKSGSEGQGSQNSTRGSSEGTEAARSDRNSITDGHRTGSGGAAEANYIGNVSSRLGRCIRNGLPSEYKRSGASGMLRVTSNANGNVVAASMARGTGVAGLDGAIISAARGCNLPSLPPEWGKPTRVLSQPVEVD